MIRSFDSIHGQNVRFTKKRTLSNLPARTMTASEIRNSFLDFFAEKQHTIVPSASLMPQSPGLLFTNAGMNPFVPYFLGVEKAPYNPPRAADTQKCIRAGGKHNDQLPSISKNVW